MRLPEWIRKEMRGTGGHEMKSFLRSRRLATVCEEARCPNQGRCFKKPTATFMILGSSCSRFCSFCSVTHEPPGGELPDPLEPARVAEAASEMNLRFVVITSPSRDDLEDGGAAQFADTIKCVREELPEARIEVLTPDFQGSREALDKVIEAGPDVFNHNVETVPRLYPEVRPQAIYRRSLRVLESARELAAGRGLSMKTKSGLMVGLGETEEEVLAVMEDLREVGCDVLTIGQYLRPRRENLPVREYVSPETFEYYRDRALSMGFGSVASAPMVRSSMDAEEVYEDARV